LNIGKENNRPNNNDNDDDFNDKNKENNIVPKLKINEVEILLFLLAIHQKKLFIVIKEDYINLLFDWYQIILNLDPIKMK